MVLKISIKCGSYGRQFNQTLGISFMNDHVYQLFKDFTTIVYGPLMTHFDHEKHRLSLSNGQQRLSLKQLNKRWKLFQDVDFFSLQQYSQHLKLMEFHQHFGMAIYDHPKLGPTMAIYMKRSSIEYNYEFYTINDPIQQISIERIYSRPTQWILISGNGDAHLILYENENKIPKFQVLNNPLQRSSIGHLCVDSKQKTIRLIKPNNDNADDQCNNDEQESTVQILSTINYGFTYKNQWLYLVSIEKQNVFYVNYQLILSKDDDDDKQRAKNYSLQMKSIRDFVANCDSLVNFDDDDDDGISTNFSHNIDDGADNDSTRFVIQSLSSKNIFSQENRLAIIIITALLLSILLVILLFAIFLISEFYLQKSTATTAIAATKKERHHYHREKKPESELLKPTTMENENNYNNNNNGDENVVDEKTETTTTTIKSISKSSTKQQSSPMIKNVKIRLRSASLSPPQPSSSSAVKSLKLQSLSEISTQKASKTSPSRSSAEINTSKSSVIVEKNEKSKKQD
ncbi:hypothetical protein DERF_014129 [Dermatophagoides farinae]|uniref:Uncharacterized protein n=1 Tax=Dermatophagoides farinae TaxID=6954 RepID=A0A922KTQ5_DERFA|nr:hypothetical protein DERF_014129 [Dermatophagoides farinae]